ncbi:MAG TPA: DUF475 domain-containing protein [bacterium]|nr:DUF475 domain-containing protein [bacterium]
MAIVSMVLTVLGLAMFETISSIDNAIINAEVLSGMSQKARKWFLFWGILFAVFVVRGALPWLIVWATTPSLGLFGSLTATFSNDPSVHAAIESSAPILLVGGGTFLVFLFLHWLFLETKHFGLPGEAFIARQGVWFYAVVSVLLVGIVWEALKIDPLLALGAVVGSSAFFITHGFKQNAERAEEQMLEGTSHMSDVSKILFLEIIDMTFSIDGVLGAFAFTLSVPLILIGNGIGALVVRYMTVSNIERIKKYALLKNGAMYSVLALGTIMLLHGFGAHIPEWVSPVVTAIIIAYFGYQSVRLVRAQEAPAFQ